MNGTGREGFYDDYLIYLKVPTWISGRGYFVDELVIYSGVMYRCITANNDAVFDPAKWESAGSSGAFEKKEYKTMMTAGQVSYSLPEIPEATFAVTVYINGVNVNFTRIGAVITITEYPAGDIENTDELKVNYFK